MSQLTKTRRPTTATEIAALVAQIDGLKLTGEQTAELIAAQHHAAADSDWQRNSGLDLLEVAGQIESECMAFTPDADEERGFIGGEMSFAERMAWQGVRV